MNIWQTNHAAPCLAEITFEAINLQYKGSTLELALERRTDGRLDLNCKQTVSAAVHKFIHKSALQTKVRVWCAVNARGLSLRRLFIPVAGAQERQRLLQLQIECEFPLPPEELAWGSAKLNGVPSQAGNAAQEHVLIAAVRRQILEDYIEIFTSCGSVPVFIPAALARVLLLPEKHGRVAHLEVGPKYSELIQLENGIPISLRTIAWGAKDLAITQPASSTSLRDSLPLPGGIALVSSPMVSGQASAIRTGASALARLIRNDAVVQKLFVSGLSADRAEFTQILREELGSPCEPLEPTPEQGRSVAIAGLAKAAEADLSILRLNIECDSKRNAPAGVRAVSVKWAAATLVIVLLAALFPYFEALACKPGLTRKLAALKADRGRLAAIDSELEFLRFLKQNQPPYLDALYMISRALPPGSRFDSVSMARRGELSLRGSMRDANQVADFRSKLLDSGLFSTVSIEEQTPTPDRQKLNIRMTALWKPDQITRGIASQFAVKEPERPKSAPPGMPPGMMAPGMMPSAAPSFPPALPGPPGAPGSGIAIAPSAIPAGGAVLPSGASPVPPGGTLPDSALQTTSAIPQTSAAPVLPNQPPSTAPTSQP